MTTALKMNDVTAFKHLSNFKSLKDFNNNMEQILLDHKGDFTKSQLIGLKQLQRFSAKVPGIATARICILVAATYAGGKMGISRKTFERMLEKAKNLGILTIYSGERFNGSQTSNVYVFNRYGSVKKLAEQQEEQPLEVDRIVPNRVTNAVSNPKKSTPLKALVLLKLSSIKSLNIRIQNRVSNKSKKETFDHTFTADFVPTEFRDFAKRYYDDAAQIEKLWKRVTIAGKKHGIEDAATLVTIGIESLKAMKRKMNHVRKDVTGYFYGILKKKMIAHVEALKTIETDDKTGQAVTTTSVRKHTYEATEPEWFKASKSKKTTRPKSAPIRDIDSERRQLQIELGQLVVY